MTHAEMKEFTLLPPPADCCQMCARKHDPNQGHDAHTMYYQVWFKMEHGRDPTWKDAYAHCTPELQQQWRETLIAHGIDVDAGDLYPRKETA